MKRAIEIVEAMIAKTNEELDDVQVKYGKTRPDSVYDARYRELLVQMHDRLISKTIVLEDVARELEKAEKAENGLVDKGV